MIDKEKRKNLMRQFPFELDEHKNQIGRKLALIMCGWKLNNLSSVKK